MDEDSMDLDGSSYVEYLKRPVGTPPLSKKRSYGKYSEDLEQLESGSAVPAQQPVVQENRRIGGMLLSVYDSMYTLSRLIVGAIWGFLLGTVHPQLPREIEAHETDSTGRKRIAIESPRTARPIYSPPSKKKTSSKTTSPPIPGGFPENAPITPPDSRPGSSQDQVNHDTPMAVSTHAAEVPPQQSESEAEPAVEPEETEQQRADRERRERIALLPKFDFLPPTIDDERRPRPLKTMEEYRREAKLAPPSRRPQPSSASASSSKPSSPIPNAVYMTPALGSKKKTKLPEDAKPSRSFSASQSQDSKLGASTMSASVRSNKKKDDEMDALITRSRLARIGPPEDRLAKRHWRERKEQQKAIEEAERERVRKEQEAAIKRAEEEQAKMTAEEYRRALEEYQKDLEASLPPDSSVLGPSTPPEEKRIRQHLIRPLDQQWEEKVTKAMETKSSNHVVTKTVDGVDLTRHDFETLLEDYGLGGQPRGWLNDEIVNGFMAAIVSAKLDNEGYKKTATSTPTFVSYNTNWYSTYKNKKGVDGIKNWSKRKGIQGAKLLKTKKIFFPINTGSHWMLLIISPQERAIEFLDSLPSTGTKEKFMKIAREWLQMELQEKYEAAEWTEKASESSHQQNFSDCGVFVCFNALASAKGGFFFEVGEGDMKQARRLMAAILLNGGLTGQYQLEMR